MKKSKLFILLLSGLTVFTTVACAQQGYTLQECIDKALSQSLQLKADGYDLDKTNAGIKQAYSALLPTISGSASYQYAFQVNASVIPSETFGGPAGTYTAAKLGVPQTKSGSISLSQNLYNASAMIGLKAAKVLVNLNKLQIESSKEDLVYNVSATYYNIQSIIKQAELTSQSLANTEALLKNTQEQLTAGLATETDVDRLSVSRDNTKASLQSLANSKEKYYNLLKVLMNVSLMENIAVQPFTGNEANVALLQLPPFDPTRKTNYLQVMENIKVANLQKQNIKAGLQPTLALSASYGLSGYYNNANPFKNINEQFYPSSSVGLSLRVPIFDGFNIKYQAKQKEFEVKKYQVQAEQTLQQNNKDDADAYADIKSNFITYQSQQRNLALAEKVMKDINQQYKSGLVKVSDVINATSDLQTAQNNFVTALINIKQAELNLRKAQGTLLQ
jgi:outer membrane protein TolC